MARVTGFTAERMQAIENSCITSGAIVFDNLHLIQRDGTVVDAGNVRGPKGDPGINGTNGTNGLDAAPGSVDPTANTTPIRTADGRVKTAPATESNDSVELALLTDGTKDVTVSKIRLKSPDTVTETSTTHPYQIGEDAGPNIAFDNHQVMARNNGVAVPLFSEAGYTTDQNVTSASPGSLTHKKYVDSLVSGIELDSGVDLNLKATPGIYTQNSDAEAANGINYPVALAGVLEVQSNTARDYTMIWQRYTPYGAYGNKFYTRAWYNATGWTPWRMYVPGDTPWTTVTSFAANVQRIASTTYGPVRYRVVGDTVEWNGPVQTTTSRSGNWAMLTVPAEAKPKYTQQITIHTGSAGGYGVTTGLWFDIMCIIDPTTGLMTAYGNAGVTWAANGYVFLNGSYPLT